MADDDGIEEPTQSEIDAIARATAAERELAIARAGIPLDTDLGAMFARAYVGALKPDEIAAEWAKVAPAPPSEPTAEEAALAAQAAAASEEPEMGSTEFERRQQLASAGGGEPPLPEDPRDLVMRQAAERGDKDTDIVRMHKGIRTFLEAAMMGDRRVSPQSRMAQRELEYVDPA